MTNAPLSIKNFSVVYDVEPPVLAVTNIDIELQRGEILGLAGESGCGKTTLAYGIQRLLKSPAVITSGSVAFHDAGGDDIDINSLGVEEMRQFKWDKISMVFQGAMNAMNPVATIGSQLEDVFEVHRPNMTKVQRREAVVELLDIVKVGGQRRGSFPHELSGGMRQRVMIAMALALRPQLMMTWMSRQPRWMCLFSAKSCGRSPNCATSSASRSSSSRTTYPSCSRSAIALRSCAQGRSSSSRRPSASGTTRRTTTRRSC